MADCVTCPDEDATCPNRLHCDNCCTCGADRGLLPCPKCGADGWSYCRDRKGEPLPLDRSHVDRRTRGVVTP